MPNWNKYYGSPATGYWETIYPSTTSTATSGTSSISNENYYSHTQDASIRYIENETWHKAAIYYQEKQRLMQINYDREKKEAVKNAQLLSAVDLLSVLIEQLRSTQTNSNDKKELLSQIINYYETYQYNLEREMKKCNIL